MNLAPTKPAMLIALAFLSGSLAWSLAHLWPQWFDTQMPLPWLTAVMMWLLAISLFMWTISARSKLQPKPGQPRMHPIVAARSAALALAASRTGALVFGFYGGVLITNLGLMNSSAGRTRVLIAGLILVASLSFILTALWLEKMCRIPKPPVDESGIASPTT